MSGAREVTLKLPPDLVQRLSRLSAAQGATDEDTIVYELRRALSGLGSGELGSSGSGLLARRHSSKIYSTAPVKGGELSGGRVQHAGSRRGRRRLLMFTAASFAGIHSRPGGEPGGGHAVGRDDGFAGAQEG